MNNFELTLKNPVWYALQETHKKHIISLHGVHFYNPEICSFGAFDNKEKTSLAVNKYAELTNKFFLVSENTDPIYDKNFVILDRKIEGVQMVLKDTLEDFEITEKIVPLTEKHIDEIYHLIWLVMPGYYQRGGFKMGAYYGIFKEGKLVSIAGERLQTNNFIEVSGVVTHPDYTRRGFAKQLVAHTTKEIIKTGKKAILHTTKGNKAIKLYEKLGYTITRDMNWWYFHKK